MGEGAEEEEEAGWTLEVMPEKEEVEEVEVEEVEEGQELPREKNRPRDVAAAAAHGAPVAGEAA